MAILRIRNVSQQQNGKAHFMSRMHNLLLCVFAHKYV